MKMKKPEPCWLTTSCTLGCIMNPLLLTTSAIRARIDHLRTISQRLSSTSYDSDSEERLESCYDEIANLERLIQDVLDAKYNRIAEYEKLRSIILQEMVNPDSYITYDSMNPEHYMDASLVEDYYRLTLYDEDTKIH